MIDTRFPKDLQHKLADQVRKGQENMNDTVRAWKDAAQSMRPQLPELSRSLPAQLPGWEMLIANTRDFAERLRVAQRRIAGQVREAAEPLAKQMHQVREAAEPLAEQVRKATAPLTDPWAKQMHQVRKATAPLTEQVRKAAAPLNGGQRVTRATVTRQPSAPAGPAGPAAATSETSTAKTSTAQASTAQASTAKTSATRKPRTAKK